MDDPQILNNGRLKYMPKNKRLSWDPKNDIRFKNQTAEGWAALRSLFRESTKPVGSMHRAGVSILAGTDTTEVVS
jgi:hypothetical protein